MLDRLLPRAAIVAATFVVALEARVEHASACSASYCGSAVAIPVTDTLPADAGGVFVYPGRRSDWSFDDFALELRLIESGKDPVVVAVTWSDPPTHGQRFVAARIADALPVGAVLELHGRDPCDGDVDPEQLPEPELLRTWTIAPALGGSITLGVIPDLTADWGTVVVPASGSCDDDAETSVTTIDLVHDASTASWEPIFVYETLVDGQPYYMPTSIDWFGGPTGTSIGGSAYGRGIDRVYARCDGLTYGVDPGPHTIAMRARLPDGRSFATNEVSVSFSCDPSSGENGNSTPWECSTCGVRPGASADPDATRRAMAAWALGIATFVAIRRVARRRRNRGVAHAS